MRTKIACLCVALLMGAVALPVVAGDTAAPAKAAQSAQEQTLEGKVMCAKCGLHEEGRTECQNVLVVDKDGKTHHYYMTKNAAYDKLGEVCGASKPVRVTGAISEAGGHTWVTASKIEPLAEKG
jgi:uncharacterized ParB-like nuclease family protein